MYIQQLKWFIHLVAWLHLSQTNLWVPKRIDIKTNQKIKI